MARCFSGMALRSFHSVHSSSAHSITWLSSKITTMIIQSDATDFKLGSPSPTPTPSQFSKKSSHLIGTFSERKPFFTENPATRVVNMFNWLCLKLLIKKFLRCFLVIPAEPKHHLWPCKIYHTATVKPFSDPVKEALFCRVLSLCSSNNIGRLMGIPMLRWCVVCIWLETFVAINPLTGPLNASEKTRFIPSVW